MSDTSRDDEPGAADDYLVLRRGPADPDVERLERLLAPLAYDPRRAPPAARDAGASASRTMGLWGWGSAVAAAAALVLALGPGPTTPPPPEGSHGPAPRLTLVGEPGALAERSWVEARDEARELRLGDVGRVTLDAGTRLEVRRVAHDVTRLYLERGRLHALVSAEARPRFFQVETPAVRCVDLGCRYTLSVDAAGDAEVQVQTGQVAFENEGREVFVPAGARCRATRAAGAGTPRWSDAAASLAAALDAFDAAVAAPAQARRGRAEALLAATSDARDCLSAWHLLQDEDAEIAAAARARLTALVGALEPEAPVQSPDASERERWKRRLEPWW